MSAFITLLDIICPVFRDFVSEQLQSQVNLKGNDQQNNVQPDACPAMNDMERFEAQRQQIQEALNRQTYHQFRAYAQQQFVGDPIQVWSYFIYANFVLFKVFSSYYIHLCISKRIITIRHISQFYSAVWIFQIL
uniref:Uncharacterized protein n=1 Tax=Elaeophora elaphi TaxID=1147741 RepID=A0A0R3RR45_9BILA